MAAVTSFEQIVNVGRESVKTTFEYIGENETPWLNYLMKKKKHLLTEFGRRLPIQTRRPGGHTSFDRSNVDFRDPVAPETDSMRAYPVWYALPFKIDGSTLRALKRGDADVFMNYKRYMATITEAAMKRLNYYFHGDATAALAVTTSAIVAAGAAQNINFQLLASAAQGEGETKGSRRMEVGHTYAVINAATAAVRYLFTVVSITDNDTVVADVTSFVAASVAGDPVVDGGSTTTLSAYKKAPNGLRGLAAQTGIIQNVSRTDYPELKTPRYNGADNPITPFAFRFAKDLVRIASNSDPSANRVIVMTPGQMGALANQQFSYRRYKSNEDVRGVAGKYIDEDGDTYIIDADGAEDRIYIVDGSSYSLGEEKPFGAYDEDGNDIRMLVGANVSGSDRFAGSVGWGGNLVKEGLPRADAYIDRLSQTDVAQQSSL
jgi:hypothetical protein